MVQLVSMRSGSLTFFVFNALFHASCCQQTSGKANSLYKLFRAISTLLGLFELSRNSSRSRDKLRVIMEC